MRALAGFTLGGILLLAYFMVLINQAAIFGDDVSTYKDALNYYTFIVIGSIAWVGIGRLEIFTLPVFSVWGLPLAAGFALLFWVCAMAAREFVGEPGGAVDVAAGAGPIILYYFLVVAFAEELFFRGALPVLGGGARWWTLGCIPFIFGMFHFAVSAGNFGYMLLMVMLGLVFGVLAERWGISAAMGAHGGWNVGVSL